MPFAILPIINSLWSGVITFASSRIGQIIIAFCVAWIWSGWKTEDHWRAIIAAEKAAAEAAYRAEISRQEQAAKDIAQAATVRAEEDAALERELRAQIEEFTSQDKPNESTSKPSAAVKKDANCVIDHDFSQFVRKLDYLDRGRKGKVTKSSR